MNSKHPKITHVAIIFQGVVYSLPAPNRHHHVFKHIIEKTGTTTYISGKQGFLDETGQFLDRKQALESALANNQVKDIHNIRAGILFSEDLW